MSLQKALAKLALFLSPTLSIAGEPIDARFDCPIGGSKIDVTETTSCSFPDLNFTMSLRRYSTCDYTTRLPVCENQAFPVYRDFSPGEVSRLMQFVETGWYQSAKTESRYLRAFLIEKNLGTSSDKELFWLLQEGHFYDHDNSYGNANYFAAFKETAENYLSSAEPNEKQFVLLASAYANVQADRPEAAIELLEFARISDDVGGPILKAYAELVENCANEGDDEICKPNHSIAFNCTPESCSVLKPRGLFNSRDPLQLK